MREPSPTTRLPPTADVQELPRPALPFQGVSSRDLFPEVAGEVGGAGVVAGQPAARVPPAVRSAPVHVVVVTGEHLAGTVGHDVELHQLAAPSGVVAVDVVHRREVEL